MKIWKYQISRIHPNESDERAWQINTGFSKNHYSERLVEQPFIFRQIRNPPAKVLDIGCWESIVPIQLAMLSYQVTGIDIQNYGYTHPNFDFIHDDFNKHDFGTEKFDIITNISAIEHFGLLFYGNMNRDDNADKKAMAKIRQLLKPKGQLLFTAPFGVHGEVENFERIYDTNDIKAMLQGFKILEMKAYSLGNAHYLEEIPIKEAEKIKHDEEEQTYAIICINSEKTG